VGQLIKMTTDKMKTQKNGGSFTAGICGEHGGDPASVAFFSRAGLDYVSCSPYRVPIAWIAAAQSAVKEGFTKEKGQENGK
jgi:pyruvate,orthophosphate dikinase